MPNPALHSVARRSPALVLASAVLLGACSSSTDPEVAFCDRANQFQEYQRQLAVAIFDPAETETFFAGSVERISELAEDAPPTVAADVGVVRDAFVRLEDELEAVDYQILELDDAALDTSESDAASTRIDEFLAVACREEGDPFSGFADDPFAPLVLLPEELDALEPTVDESGDQLEQLVASQLAEEFDLPRETARCIVDGLDVSFIAAIASGGAVTDDAAQRFVEVMASCGVDETQVAGD